MEAYHISYDNDDLKEFTRSQYDGSEYIFIEKYKIDPSERSGLKKVDFTIAVE